MLKGREYYKEKYESYLLLTQYAGDNITHQQTIEILTKIVSRINSGPQKKIIPFSRKEKRSKELLLQWCESNLHLIEEHIGQIVLVDENDKILDPFEPQKKFLWKFRDETQNTFSKIFDFDFNDISNRESEDDYNF